jgi:hypothetical protein
MLENAIGISIMHYYSCVKGVAVGSLIVIVGTCPCYFYFWSWILRQGR